MTDPITLIQPQASPAQQREMRRDIARLWGLAVMLALAWAGVGALVRRPWPSGPVWAAATLALWLLALLLTWRVRRAYRYHLILPAVVAPVVLAFFDAASRLALKALGPAGWAVVGVAGVAVAIGVVARSSAARAQLRLAQRFNEASDRLDVRAGTWDLTAPLRLDSPEAEAADRSRWRRLARLSAFGPAIGFALARNLADQALGLVIACLFFFLAWAFAWGYGRPVGIALQLADWEREWGKRILIP